MRSLTVAPLVLLAACGPGDRGVADAPEAPLPWLREEAAARGIDFVHRSGHEGRHFFPELMGGGAALFDADGDGDLDAFLVQSGHVSSTGPTAHRLYQNDGAGHFTDVSASSGVAVPGYGQGVTAGDFDGDGDVDLYVTNVGPDRLLENDGAGRFTDATEPAGLGHPGWSTSAAFVDVDGDGDLDLFVACYVDWSVATELDCFDPTGQPDYCGPVSYEAPAADVLYRNDGDGTFTDVTATWLGESPNGSGNGLGVVAGDFDGDGRQDVFVANDQTPDNLWVHGEGDLLVDAAERLGVARDPYGGVRAGMGVDAADVDGDDDLDLLVVHMAREQDGFFVNQGGYFTERTGPSGIGVGTFTSTRFGVGFHDLDRDGWLDLFVANGRVNLMMEPLRADDPYAEPGTLLRGTPDGRWVPVLPAGGTASQLVATSRGAAFGDVDGDGAVDVLVVNRDAPAHLLMNVAPARGGALVVRLLDRGRDALGASARIALGARTLRRECRAAYSYCSASDPRLVFGLGDARVVSVVDVRWADGAEQRFEGPFAAGDRVTLTRR